MRAIVEEKQSPSLFERQLQAICEQCEKHNPYLIM